MWGKLQLNLQMQLDLASPQTIYNLMLHDIGRYADAHTTENSAYDLHKNFWSVAQYFSQG